MTATKHDQCVSITHIIYTPNNQPLKLTPKEEIKVNHITFSWVINPYYCPNT